MCLILLAHKTHPRYRLILAANRDEMHSRPTAPLQEWSDLPGIFGGRDLQAGGSWLAVNRGGRWAAVTNYREPQEAFSPAYPTSRGDLVSAFVLADDPPLDFLHDLSPRAADFAGFNLLVGDDENCGWLSNRALPPEPLLVDPGVHGLSNHLLDTPWPKVSRGKAALEKLVRAGSVAEDDLLSILLDKAVAADHDLPGTGVSIELERSLSAAFISSGGYGTRCSTAVLIGRDGAILMAERRFGSDGELTGETRVEL